MWLRLFFYGAQAVAALAINKKHLVEGHFYFIGRQLSSIKYVYFFLRRFRLKVSAQAGSRASLAAYRFSVLSR